MTEFEESPEFFTALCEWAFDDPDIRARFETTDAYQDALDQWEGVNGLSDQLDRLAELRRRAG